MSYTRPFRNFSWAIVPLLLILPHLSWASPYSLLPAIAQTTQDRKAEGDLLLKEGIQQFQTGQFEAAIQSWKQAVIFYREISDRSGEGQVLADLGMTYFLLRNYDKAAEYYQQSWEIAREMKDVEAKRRRLKNLGTTYRLIGYAYIKGVDYTKSIKYFQDSLAIAKELKEYQDEIGVLLGLAIVYHKLGRYSEAIKYDQQSLGISRKLKDRKLEGKILGNLGYTYGAMGEYSKTIDYCQKSLEIAREYRDRDAEQNALGNLGVAYLHTGLPNEAIKNHQKRLAILKEINDPYSEILTLIDLGNIYTFLGEHTKAIENIHKALEIVQKTDDFSQQANLLLNLGSNYIHLGDYTTATQYLQQSLFLAQRTRDLETEGRALGNLGLIHLHQSNFSKAIFYFQQRLAIARKVQNRQTEAVGLGNLGVAYFAQKQYAQAFAYCQQALFLFQRVKDREGEGTTLSNIGAFFNQQKQPELAIVFYKQSVNVREAIRADIHSLSRESQEAYTQSVADTYRSLADLLIQQGRISEAQQVLELLKIQEINDFTRGTRTPNITGQVELNTIETQIRDRYGSLIAFGQKLAACEQTQCAERATLRTQLHQQQTEFSTLVSRIRDRLQGLRAQQVTTNTDEFISKAAKIVNAQTHTLLIYPLVLPDKVQILWATAGKNQGAVLSGTTTSCPLHEATELNPLISDLQTHLAHQGNLKELQATSQKLYNCLIQPLEPELKQLRERAAADHAVPHLVFVPDRGTHLIPMAVLFDGKHYLIETYNISNILSASNTDATAKLPRDRRSISVLGFGLSEAKPGFSALAYVPIELASIIKSKSSTASKGIYNGDEFLNQKFTQNTLEAQIPGHTIIHIATHGVFKPSNPRSSFLLLGDGTEFAIPNIQFLEGLSTVHLVVLSACETAIVGTDTNGTEVAGISSYFLQNGAKAVIASLWKVNDPATSLLMQQFYQTLANGTSKATALRQVQLDFIQGKRTIKDAEALDRASARPLVSGQPTPADFSHPYYWAPFILIGNNL